VVSRRTFLTSCLAAGVCAKSAPIVTLPKPKYSSLAIDLVHRSTVIDMLGLLTLDYRKLGVWQQDPARFQPSDFQRLKDSGINIFHPAVGFVEGDIYKESLRDITGWNLFIADHRNDFLRVDSVSDIALAKAKGKIGIVVGQQNSEHFRSVDDVNRFYAMGQRVSQLTYRDNRIGGGSTDPRNLGLTKYGGEIVQRMNDLGMAIDVSHCSDRTALDAIEASAKPVLVTHSNCRALVPGSARCRTDETIKKLAAKGGVLGVTMVRIFVGKGDPVTIDNVLDHIDHVVQIAGIEHVGVGTDVDLVGRDRAGAPKRSDLDGLIYPDKIYELTQGLLHRSYSQSDIELILGKNFERALGEIWKA
jgi:membrane dipeptidase